MRAAAAVAIACLALGAVEARAQPLAPNARVKVPGATPADSCHILIPAVGYDMSDPEQAAQASADVQRVRAALELALERSKDMKAKVLDACSEKKNGVRGHPRSPTTIRIFVRRDHPKVDYGVSNPASQGNSGNMVIDLGDLDAMKDYFVEGSDPQLIQEITRNALKRVLAHEFDHLRDPPNRGAWGLHHGDPLGHRESMGEPVRDANTVIAQVGGRETRTQYGADRIPYQGRPGTTMEGKAAVLRYTDLVNRGRTAGNRGSGGSGFGTPLPLDGGAIGGLPAGPCGAAGGQGCYPSPAVGDADLDGIPDDVDLCPGFGNPWNLDADGDGVGDDCQPLGGVPSFAFTPLLNSPITAGAGLDWVIQVMFVYLEEEGDRSRAPAPSPLPGGAAGRADPRMWITALGGSSGAVVRLTVADPEGEIGSLAGRAFVAEPVALGDGARRRLEQEVARETSRGARPVPASAYCLEMHRDAPAAGQALRIADAPTQRRYRGVREILEAARRVERAGRFTPDSEPVEYAHAIRQWAIWTRLEDLDYDMFVVKVLDYARANFEAAGRPWTEEMAEAIRGLLPNRWKDVNAVLVEVGSY